MAARKGIVELTMIIRDIDPLDRLITVRIESSSFLGHALAIKDLNLRLNTTVRGPDLGERFLFTSR